MLHSFFLQQEKCICVGFLYWSLHRAQYNHCAEHYDYLYHWNLHLVLMYSPAYFCTEVFPQEIKLHIRRSSMRFDFKFRETFLQKQIRGFSEQLNFTTYNSIFPQRGSMEHKVVYLNCRIPRPRVENQTLLLVSLWFLMFPSSQKPSTLGSLTSVSGTRALRQKGKHAVILLRAKKRLSNCNFSHCLVKQTPCAETNHLQKILKFGSDNRREIQLFESFEVLCQACPRAHGASMAGEPLQVRHTLRRVAGSSRLCWWSLASATILWAALGSFCQCHS